MGITAAKLTDLFRSAQVHLTDDCCYVAVTDQASDQIIVLDPAEADWDNKAAVKWSWSASASNGFEGLESSWGLPTDAKVRANETFGGHWMVVTDSRGLAAIVPYPLGDSRKWGLNVGGNPHSAELLPNGNIAVAASTGGWVRVYASSQGADSAGYAEYPFPGAHGVQWDPQRQVLWALGNDDLVTLEISGTDSAPVVREVNKVALPTRHGHDLQPVYGDTDRLWISTGTKVYQYVKSKNKFDESYPGSANISRAGVKSVGNLSTGQVVSTVPDNIERFDTGCDNNDWCTNIVDFFNDDTTRKTSQAAIYKARVWNADYV